MAQTFLNIFLGSFFIETIPTHYHSHLRFGKTCQEAITLSQPLRDFLCSASFLPTPARCPVTPARPPRDSPASLHWAVIQSRVFRLYQNAQVPWATRINRRLHCQVWQSQTDSSERGQPHFIMTVCQVPRAFATIALISPCKATHCLGGTLSISLSLCLLLFTIHKEEWESLVLIEELS